MPVNGYVLKEVSKHGLNAVNASNITDAEVNPLTTANAFKALFTNRQSGGVTQRADMEFHEASIDQAIAAGILTDANVAAANTMDGIRDLFIAANPELTRSFQSGNRAWQ